MSDPKREITFANLVFEGRNGNIKITVNCGLDAAARTLNDAKRDGKLAKFTAPLSELPVHVNPEMGTLLFIEEQKAVVENDPRAVGQFRTPSGIELPGAR